MHKINVYFILSIFYVSQYTTSGEIIAVDRYNNSDTFEDLESEFGNTVGTDGLVGILMNAEPLNACKPIKERPYINGSKDNITVNAFVLIERGGCDFGIKVLNAQNANFDGAIVFNDRSDELLRMSSAYKDISLQINIPSVFVSETSGAQLFDYYLYFYKSGPYIEIYSDGEPFSIKYYILPFSIVLGTCFIALLIFMLVRFVRIRHRHRRNRLSRQRLKQLPVKAYEKGDEYDVCAICLDDYEEGEKLRILPCQHAYHCKCVDPWLTSSKRVCPLCKRRVLSDDETSNSDTEYDSDSEHAPLLQNSEASSPNAARFATGFSSENPIMRSYSTGDESTTTSLVSGDRASFEENVDIPSSSGNQSSSLNNLHGNTVSPEFFSTVESSPNQLVVFAEVFPQDEVNITNESTEEYSCVSGEDSTVGSYPENPDVLVIQDGNHANESSSSPGEPTIT